MDVSAGFECSHGNNLLRTYEYEGGILAGVVEWHRSHRSPLGDTSGRNIRRNVVEAGSDYPHLFLVATTAPISERPVQAARQIGGDLLA
ncbi:hypothetical protein, partial [Rhizobium laguerreae]|uniref:hypothetical protein n=1 Tax=Rhizobium laguerreae TaxID=1076926 RepID=UPI001C929165